MKSERRFPYLLFVVCVVAAVPFAWGAGGLKGLDSAEPVNQAASPPRPVPPLQAVDVDGVPSPVPIILSHGAYGVPVCGTPRVETYVNGFNLDGTVHGVVRSRSSCSTGGRGSKPRVKWNTAETSWELDGSVLFTNYPCVGSCLIDPYFTATDTSGRQIYNVQGYFGGYFVYRGVLHIPDPTTFTKITFRDIVIGEPSQ